MGCLILVARVEAIQCTKPENNFRLAERIFGEFGVWLTFGKFKTFQKFQVTVTIKFLKTVAIKRIIYLTQKIR
jgi:hypothetical protein